MTLSLCMIVRDEADQIEECLQSVESLVDEMVIVDTGSSDETVALAQRHGARVISADWPNDFSEVRNRALDNASGNWVLVLDADERIFPRHFEAIRRLIAKHPIRAIQVVVRTYTNDSTLINWQPIERTRTEAKGFCGYYDSFQIRLFRRTDRVRHEGIVHETVASSLARNGIPVHRADVIIHHYKENRSLETRQARNRLIFDLSRRRTESDESEPDPWRQRAIAALAIGEYQDAIDSFQQAIQRFPEKRDNYLYLGYVLSGCGKADQASVLLHDALERFPDEPELVQLLGDALLTDGQIEEAREEFSRSLELDPYLYGSLAGLGAIAMREKRFAAAVDYFERAKSIHPEADGPYVNLGQIYLAQGQLDKALSELRYAFSLNPMRWQSLAGIGEILFKSGRNDDAMEWYQKAASIEDCGPEVFARLCAGNLALGRSEVALRWAEKAAASGPAFHELPSLVTSSKET